MLFAIVGVLIALLVYFPQLWVRFVMYRHGKEMPGMPGTGGELAEHLLDKFDLQGFVVEETMPFGDHFDPSDRAVRLSPKNYSGRSLTAIAVATHEVGHALQFHGNEPLFELRKKYIPQALALKRLGIILMFAVPLVGIIAKAPVIVVLTAAVSIVLQLLGALMYLIVLPEEWDASFNKALPILERGQYVPKEYLPAVSSVLKAAALTYFSGALADILNIGRWLVIIFRR